jgi:hypothetical protein
MPETTWPREGPRYFRITRGKHGVRAWTTGEWDGGPLLFVRFWTEQGGHYFYSLRAVEQDQSGLFIEVDRIGQRVDFPPAHPDVLSPLKVSV